jgi:transcriptional regulator with XRE-family HTH domain
MLSSMRDKTLARKFGTTVRRLRLEAKMSQEEFADLCGLHRTYIGLIERGERIVTIDTASKLAVALNVSLAQLFYEVEQTSQPDTPH